MPYGSKGTDEVTSASCLAEDASGSGLSSRFWRPLCLGPSLWALGAA